MLVRILHRVPTGVCRATSQPAAVQATVDQPCRVADARGCSAMPAGLEKVSLNPRKRGGRTSSSFHRHGSVLCLGCVGPGSNLGVTSLARSDQGCTHPLLGLERCIGRAGGHESAADTPVLQL